MSFSNKQSLPRDVQENIIHNIQQVFPNVISKTLIRNVLNEENWDLEKSLRFLHSKLQSYNDKKKKNENKKPKNQNNNSNKTSSRNKEISNTDTQNKVPLFKSAPKTLKKSKTQKEKNGNEQNSDWVIINKPPDESISEPIVPKVKPKKAKVNEVTKPTKSDLMKRVQEDNSHNLPSSSSSRQARRNQLIKNYEIIKLFKDTADRIIQYIKEGIKVMVLLRGCSGSGKTTYANTLLQKAGAKNPQNHIFCTDNYFVQADGRYIFYANLLQEAHEWNKKLVKLSANEGRSPIFVDNTNSCLWEMKEYAEIAVKYGYILETLEPPTPWFFNENILFRKSKHSAPRETIRRMLDRYEANLSGEDILRKLHLSYVPPMIPPIGSMAGIETPISKKHSRMLGIPLESMHNSASCDSKMNPNSSKSITSMTPKPIINDQFESFVSSLKMNQTFQKQKQYEVNMPIDIGDEVLQDLEKDPISSVNQVFKFSVHDSKSTLQAGLSSNDSSSEERESEELESSSLSDENSQNESDFEELSSNCEVDNFEYVLISENNLVIFQKEHEKMKNILTIEQFQALSDNKAIIFEEYVSDFLQSYKPNKTETSIGASGDFRTLTSMNPSNVPNFELISNSNLSSETKSTNSQLLNSLDCQNLNNDLININEEKNCKMPQNIVPSQEGLFSHHSNVVDSPCFTSEVLSLPKNKTEPSILNQESEGATGGNNGVDTLHKLFPKVPKENLLELFGTTLFDIDWAVDLLLESGQEMVHSPALDDYKHSEYMPQEEKQNVACQKTTNISHEIIHVSENLSCQMKSKDNKAIDKSDFSNEISSFANSCNSSSPHLKNDGKIYPSLNLASFGVNSPTEAPKYIGDWDFKKELPKELPVDLPRVQRTYNSFKRNTLGIEVATNTNYKDFEILRNLNGGCISKGVKINVLVGNNSFVSSQAEHIRVSSVLMLEKGTMTSSIETNHVQTSTGIERLALMFPRVSKENLEELFEKCHKDIDWAAGLLLDSGQEMSELFTSLEPIDFCEEASESPETENNDSTTGPKDLLQNNKNTKVSRRRKRTRHPVKKELQEIKESIQNNIVLDESCYSSEKMKNYFQHKNKNVNTADDNEDFQPNLNKEFANEATDLSDPEDDIVFSFDKELILQLQSRFGGLLRPNMIGETTYVNLPLSLARQLHSYVMDSINEHIKEEDVFTDEDEEYARHLQEEEMRTHRGAPSLIEIMDEEVAHRKSQKDLATGRSMASTLSKQLLIERFPKMDPSTLAMILEDTNHSLHEATALLSSAGHEQGEVELSPTKSSVTASKTNQLTRDEAIKHADAYGDVSSQLYEMRKDCLQKSQKAYKEGNYAVAVYYSDMARWYMERIEKCNSMAAKAILAGYEGWTTLDLHFLQVGEALNVLDLFIDEVIRDLKDSNKKRTEVFVITGRGLHSVGGRPKLKPAVKNRLNQRELRFHELNPGMLKVTISRNALISYKQETIV